MLKKDVLIHHTHHPPARGAPRSATRLPRARCTCHPLYWKPLVPARVLRTAVCELVNRLLGPGTSPRQDRLNPGVLRRQGHRHPVDYLLRTRVSGSVAGLLPQLIVALAVVPENLTPSGYRSAREYAHDEVRAWLGVVAIRFDHARLREGVCDVRGARFVGSRGGVSPKVDLARSYVDVWGDEDIVRVHLHGVARKLVASGGR
eukprot:scaffold38702_cov62-Phaeocystis_antarctica.AAC.2